VIYLDHHATTPIDPRVLEVMLPYLKEHYGNPASRTHKYGWNAEEAVEDAREHVAKLISCSPHQIVFTSGATESNNTILKQNSFKSIITSTIEHSSVSMVCKYLENHKHFAFLKPDKRGICNIEELKNLPKPDLISVMLVNNEIGTIQPISKINELREEGTLIHSDMAQALGKISIEIEKLNVDFAAFSAHKIYGPKGIGALYLKESDSIEPFMHGGAQESGRRAGTLNVPAIVGFGKACNIAKDELDQALFKTVMAREVLLEELVKLIPGMKYHNFYPQVPGSLHISLPCNDMTMLLGILSNKVALSLTSACMSINSTPSGVLKEVLLSDEEAKKSIRLCTGRFNTFEEMREAAQNIAEAVKIVNAEVKI